MNNNIREIKFKPGSGLSLRQIHMADFTLSLNFSSASSDTCTSVRFALKSFDSPFKVSPKNFRSFVIP